MSKLDWLNHQWIMASGDAEHERLVAERLPVGTPAPAVAAIAAAVKSSLERYGDVPQAAAPLLERPALDSATRQAVAAAAEPLALFADLRRAAPALYLTLEQARELLGEYRRLGKERSLTARELLMPLRLALTGREHGPDLAFVLGAIAADEALERLSLAVNAAPPAADTPADETAPPCGALPGTTEGDQR
jgi:glutamyl/glutaminyl-tRNA synthetase